jgi:hypothetical protein
METKQKKKKRNKHMRKCSQDEKKTKKKGNLHKTGVEK